MCLLGTISCSVSINKAFQVGGILKIDRVISKGLIHNNGCPIDLCKRSTQEEIAKILEEVRIKQEALAIEEAARKQEEAARKQEEAIIEEARKQEDARKQAARKEAACDDVLMLDELPSQASQLAQMVLSGRKRISIQREPSKRTRTKKVNIKKSYKEVDESSADTKTGTKKIVILAKDAFRGTDNRKPADVIRKFLKKRFPDYVSVVEMRERNSKGGDFIFAIKYDDEDYFPESYEAFKILGIVDAGDESAPQMEGCDMVLSFNYETEQFCNMDDSVWEEIIEKFISSSA